MEPTAVVVTTRHRGVFFGYLDGEPSRKSLTLDRARMCVYWSAETRGVLGLASHGPAEGSKVTRALTDSIIIYDVTAVMGASPESVERWEAGPWA